MPPPSSVNRQSHGLVPGAGQANGSWLGQQEIDVAAEAGSTRPSTLAAPDLESCPLGVLSALMVVANAPQLPGDCDRLPHHDQSRRRLPGEHQDQIAVGWSDIDGGLDRAAADSRTV